MQELTSTKETQNVYYVKSTREREKNLVNPSSNHASGRPICSLNIAHELTA
jgi:hypothetical protein